MKLNKWHVFDQIGYKPHPGQQQIIESTARMRLVSAGRRFGKSDVGGHELVVEALYAATVMEELKARRKRREFWIVGPEYTDSEKEFRVLYNMLSALQVPFDRPGTYNDPISGNMHISLWGGAFQVHAKSAKYPGTLVGEGLHGVILAEAAKLKPKVWPKFIRPTLADHKGWALLTSTPEGKNWFYDMYKMGQDPLIKDWQSWRRPAWMNPYVYDQPTLASHIRRLRELKEKQDPLKQQLSNEALVELYGLKIDPEILAMFGDLTPESFQQEVAADFTEFVGRVFKDFDEETHVFDLKWQPTWETYAAVDYGYTNPNVWLLIQVGPWGEVHILDEIYERNLTDIEFADRIKESGLCPADLRCFFPDPADPGATAQLTKTLKKPSKTGTGGELRHRLDAIRNALKPPEHLRHLAWDHPERLPVLRINRKCKETIREMQEYRYPETREESSTLSAEQPMKKDDHTPEALGRFFKGYFGTPAQRAARTRKRKLSISRR